VSDPLAPLSVTIKGPSGQPQQLQFPNLNLSGGEDTQTNLIMPEPTVFLSGLPVVSIIRPTAPQRTAMGAVKALTDDGLFIGQKPEFFTLLHRLAVAVDGAASED
jgi:hypothetical protein